MSTDLRMLIRQTARIRAESDKLQTTITWTPNAKKIFNGIKSNIKERVPGIEITKSLILETFITLCRNILLKDEIHKEAVSK